MTSLASYVVPELHSSYSEGSVTKVGAFLTDEWNANVCKVQPSAVGAGNKAAVVS